MTNGGYQTSSKYVKELIDVNSVDTFRTMRIRHFKSSKEALAYESKFLRKVDAMYNKRFLNLTNGGEEFRCKCHTIKTRKLISNALRNRLPISEATRAKLSLAARNRAPVSDITRERNRIAATGRTHTDEAKEKMRAAR